MRAPAIALALLSAVLALPAAEASHPQTCAWDDAPCVVDCLLFHDPCGIDAQSDCPPLSDLLAPLPVCLYAEGCPAPFVVGVIVYVEGQRHGVCVL